MKTSHPPTIALIRPQVFSRNSPASLDVTGMERDRGTLGQGTPALPVAQKTSSRICFFSSRDTSSGSRSQCRMRQLEFPAGRCRIQEQFRFYLHSLHYLDWRTSEESWYSVKHAMAYMGAGESLRSREELIRTSRLTPNG